MLCSIIFLPPQAVFLIMLIIAVPLRVKSRWICHLRPAPVLARQGQITLQVELQRDLLRLLRMCTMCLIIVLRLSVLQHRLIGLLAWSCPRVDLHMNRSLR